jgi:uncharacterized membrane protein YdjX (TVP38/TMEM64 family)
VPEGGPRRRWWAWLLAGLVLTGAVAALLWWARPVYAFLSDQERISTWVQDLGLWGPLAVALLEMSQALVAPIPGTAIEAASGFLYGPWWGTLYAMIGLVIGAFLAFLLARRFGRPLVERLISRSALARLDDLAAQGGDLFFFLLWLFPLVPDDLVCLAAGLTEMSARRYLVLMSIGRLPGILASVWIGSHATHLGPIGWIALLAGMTLIALVLWRWGQQIEAVVLYFVRRLTDQLRH